MNKKILLTRILLGIWVFIISSISFLIVNPLEQLLAVISLVFVFYYLANEYITAKIRKERKLKQWEQKNKEIEYELKLMNLEAKIKGLNMVIEMSEKTIEDLKRLKNFKSLDELEKTIEDLKRLDEIEKIIKEGLNDQR